jgi:hypothetical protein
MTMALRDPSCCANIIAVDNAPVDAALSGDFPRYVQGMKKVEEAKVSSQKEADQILEPFAKVCYLSPAIILKRDKHGRETSLV